MDYIKLGFLKETIISYIQKNKDIDYIALGKYINAPKSLILELVQQLIDEDYITCTEDRIFLTPKCEKIRLVEWDLLKQTISNNESIFKENNFTWDLLYIPNNFKIE